jgi:HD-GYP domain-containing protein (c-di-GMP phosphodiesterase class II)
VEEIRAWSARQFSPYIVDALVRLHDRGDLSEIESRQESHQLAA